MEKFNLAIVGVVAVVAVFSIVAMLVVQSSTGFALRSSAATLSESTYSCTDSDGKNNFYEAGYVTISGKTYEDYCDGSYAIDYWCPPSAIDDDTGYDVPIPNAVKTSTPTPVGVKPGSSSFLCPNDCLGGACLAYNNTCFDSDGGIDLNVSGNVSGYHNGSYYFYTDYCSSPTSLKEYYCSGDVWRFQPSGCGNGCSDGVCIQNTTYCGDGLCNGNESWNTCPQDCLDTIPPVFYEFSVTPLSSAMLNVTIRAYDTQSKMDSVALFVIKRNSSGTYYFNYNTSNSCQGETWCHYTHTFYGNANWTFYAFATDLADNTADQTKYFDNS